MSLTAGTRLGVYEITALIGAGGMGEVYRARDTRLNRDVALKVLPELFATDPDRLARFKREAQVLASLNHPNVAAIYGFEDSGGVHALVLELVEGPTLADRIAQGSGGPEGPPLRQTGESVHRDRRGGPSGPPIPIEEALPIARQIAEALEVAHEHGIVHRDLKPANIKVRPDGAVKVLDFGLAKAFGPAEAGHYVQDGAGAAALSMSPTITSPAATRIGVILGTAAYMSPEQARGKAVDKRSDIWAFGCVLYEMLTGRRAFDGEEVTDVLARIIEREPDWTALAPTTPAPVQRLLHRCLEKDRKRRLPDIGMARIEIDDALAGSPAAGVVPMPARRMRPWVAAAVTVTAAVAGAAGWMLKPVPMPEPRAVARFSYTLPQNQIFRNPGRPLVAISPDGRQFIYNVNGGLYLRAMDGLNARLIQGTEQNLANPFFSNDGQWVGFFAEGQLKKIPVAGGTPVTLCKVTAPFGASWGADNTIVFGQPEGIMRVSANGGTPELVVATEKGEQVHGPQMLPDGQWVLFSLTRGSGLTRWDVAEIVAQSLESGERKVLWRGGSDARYVSTGHLIYALGDALFALPLDLDRLEVSGGPVPLLSGLQRATGPGQNTASAQYEVSDGGTLVHVAGTSVVGGQARTLVWVDRNGREEAIAAPPRAYLYPRVSPDGTQVALDVREQENDIWIWSLARRTLTRLTFDPGLDRYPLWTPDGRRIAFSAQRAGAPNLFWQAADGTGAAERLTESPYTQYPHSITADGTGLVFEEQGQPGIDVHVLALTGERRATPLVATMFTERNGDLSADGRWVAYESEESGRNEVYVRPFPKVDGGRWQVSTGGGTQPRWAPDSRELYFVDPEGRIIAVPVQPGPGFVAGNPQVIVKSPLVTNPSGIVGRMYDVSRDGRRFLLVKAGEGRQAAPPPQIIVVQNWHEELKRLAPAAD